MNNIIIKNTQSCLYLGLIIDSKLNWRLHIESKCLAAMRSWFHVQRCVRRTWGLSRDKLSLLYKTIFLPKILYCCTVWAKATLRKTIARLLNSTQRLCTLSISRVFKTTSSDAAAVLASLLPLDLKVGELVLRRALSPMASLLPGSTLAMVVSARDEIAAKHLPPKVSIVSFRSRQINLCSTALWNGRWSACSSGKITRLFFPKVEDATVLAVREAPHTLMQLLSGHSVLNQFFHKIGKSPSPLCACLREEEDVPHFLFTCPIFEVERRPLKLAVQRSLLPWPPPLFELPRSLSLWRSLLVFIKSTNRLSGHSATAVSGPPIPVPSNADH